MDNPTNNKISRAYKASFIVTIAAACLTGLYCTINIGHQNYSTYGSVIVAPNKLHEIQRANIERKFREGKEFKVEFI